MQNISKGWLKEVTSDQTIFLSHRAPENLKHKLQESLESPSQSCEEKNDARKDINIKLI